MKHLKKPAILTFFSFLCFVLFGYQNCAPTNFSKDSIEQPSLSTQNIPSVTTTTGPVNFGSTITSLNSTTTTTTTTIYPPGGSGCVFAGRAVREGEVVRGYQYANVTSGNQCIPHDMTCTNNKLEGSDIYTYEFCSPLPTYADCGTVPVGGEGYCALKANNVMNIPFNGYTGYIRWTGVAGTASTGVSVPSIPANQAIEIIDGQFKYLGVENVNLVVKASAATVAGTYFYVKVFSWPDMSRQVYLKMTIVP